MQGADTGERRLIVERDFTRQTLECKKIVRILNQPDIRERILADGSEPVGNSPEEFRQYMLADLAKWAKLAKESVATLD